MQQKKSLNIHVDLNSYDINSTNAFLCITSMALI